MNIYMPVCVLQVEEKRDPRLKNVPMGEDQLYDGNVQYHISPT